MTLNHDDDFITNGNNVSCEMLEKSEVLKKALETPLTGEPEEDTYNFRLVFKEEPKAEFPKLFALIGGKKWKVGEIPKACYMKIWGFGLNAPKTYCRIEDKSDWWPRSPNGTISETPLKLQRRNVPR